MVKIALDSLGCKLNQAETEALARQFAGVGYELVAAPARADIYILNTCTVTHTADRKSRYLLRRARRLNPEALVVATGCYAERAPRELAEVGGVNLVLGNRDKPHLIRRLEESGLLKPPASGLVGSYQGLRTRAFIKIQDGCRNFCSYCIVPLVRGVEISLPAGEIVGLVRERAAQGYREAVLTGVRVGAYGDSGLNLTGLLGRILAETGMERLRLSSLQPGEVSKELIALFGDERLCPHVHLCLQSGSDGVLHRMGRRYLRADYEAAVSLIRRAVPDVAITTDVMVGFPGETEAEFKESLAFCRSMEFARIHVFAYSRRSGTKAAGLPGQVSDRVRKQRSQVMLRLAEESAWGFRRRFLGKTLPVLFEQRSKGVWSGLAANYIKVYTKAAGDLSNKLLPVRLGKLYGDGVWGEIK
ncbi:MAG: tRNA (N(6)-L-threonylcarbamoyladenosine(37)-C(2))-methylthiotransferase MtaB [Dehalococcoidales bacterium]|nr:tRNA (N(6)-L-threonylcarbamoyladenosine(37)-C(2))-methylthiotransferase MtaB [Dehalococcoidales bacterium]